MHTTVFSGSIRGVQGLTVEVEVDIARGIPVFSIVGLPNAEVRESRERVTAAIKNTGIEFPLERITVNLAPADIKKEGAAFDLAIAVGIILTDACKRTKKSVAGNPSLVNPPTLFLGELTLGGALRRVRGVLPVLLHARDHGFSRAIIPSENFPESRVVSGIEVFGCGTLADVLGLLVAGDDSGVLDEAMRLMSSKAATPFAGGWGQRGPIRGEPAAEFDGSCGRSSVRRESEAGFEGRCETSPVRRESEMEFDGQRHGARVLHKSSEESSPHLGGEDDRPFDEFGDMKDVFGQESVKRALLVAAAGGHHVLLVGPPGSGKTMLARRFASILPMLDERMAIETTMIYSTAGLLNGAGLVSRCPFRAPHHSASDAGLIGGGNTPRPGEVTLAHNGVLFLDEFPEFKRHVLETLREPLEEGRITISRAKSTVTFPARFQLVAAMNPCPCGHRGNPEEICRCSRHQAERYTSKVSGPLLDRISIHVFVRPVEIAALRAKREGDSSALMRCEITKARDIQRRRNPVGRKNDGFGGSVTILNARLAENHLRDLCRLNPAGEDLLAKGLRQLKISARGRSQVIRVARTIADLEGAARIVPEHLAEAIQYRMREFPF